jgi:hypothetical protein
MLNKSHVFEVVHDDEEEEAGENWDCSNVWSLVQPALYFLIRMSAVVLNKEVGVFMIACGLVFDYIFL